MHVGITWGLLGLNPNGGASRRWGSGSPALTLSWLLAGALSILAAGCGPSWPGPWHNYSLGSCGGLSGGAPEKVGPLGPWGWHLIWEKGLSRCQEGFLEKATLDCPGRPWVLDKCSEKRREGERHRETQRDSERHGDLGRRPWEGSMSQGPPGPPAFPIPQTWGGAAEGASPARGVTSGFWPRDPCDNVSHCSKPQWSGDC